MVKAYATVEYVYTFEGEEEKKLRHTQKKIKSVYIVLS